MNTASPIAIVGLYRSGSSALAGVLHRLGVHFGDRFWGDHYEEIGLSERLRGFWREPDLIPSTTSAERTAFLRDWIADRHASGAPHVGAKHPLLSLCCHELAEAWGSGTRFIWSWRELDQSIESMVRAKWNWDSPARIQTTLWNALEQAQQAVSLHRVDYAEMLRSPETTIANLIEHLDLRCDGRAIQDAVSFIKSHPASQQARTTAVNVSSTASAEGGGRSPMLVATMLAGNAADVVEESVHSFVHLVDELILIDTGITDDTIEIVKNICGQKLHIVDFPWCDDFAAARNFALDAAAARGATWTMTTDTDERFVFDAALDRQSLLHQLSQDPTIAAWMLRVRDGSYSKERFIAVPTQLRWKGRTHEALVGFGTLKRQVVDNGFFWEPAKDHGRRMHKFTRDRTMLLQQVQETPDNPRWWYYLGQTHESLGENAEAGEAFKRCAELDGWVPESAGACFRRAHCLRSLQQFRKAEESAVFGLSRLPQSPELLWIAGLCCYDQEKYHRAIFWCELSVEQGAYRGLGDPKTAKEHIAFLHLPAWYEAPLDVLRWAYHKTGQHRAYQRAEREFEQAKMIRLSRVAPGK